MSYFTTIVATIFIPFNSALDTTHGAAHTAANMCTLESAVTPAYDAAIETSDAAIRAALVSTLGAAHVAALGAAINAAFGTALNSTYWPTHDAAIETSYAALRTALEAALGSTLEAAHI
jgi:hypothetical protein